MEFLKELFNDPANNNSLTYDGFVAACNNAGIKLANLSSGEYVSKAKFDSEVAGKASQIEKLNESIKTRDTDLEALKKQLKEAGSDTTKLSELTAQFEALQSQHTADIDAYKKQLSQQAYEFAVKEYAATKEFSSKAAKRDFISSMLAENLKVKDGSIIGADDFAKNYSTNNSDAFVQVQTPEPETVPDPKFVAPTTPTSGQGTNESLFNFNFTGVRPH